MNRMRCAYGSRNEPYELAPLTVCAAHTFAESRKGAIDRPPFGGSADAQEEKEAARPAEPAPGPCRAPSKPPAHGVASIPFGKPPINAPRWPARPTAWGRAGC